MNATTFFSAAPARTATVSQTRCADVADPAIAPLIAVLDQHRGILCWSGCQGHCDGHSLTHYPYVEFAADMAQARRINSIVDVLFRSTRLHLDWVLTARFNSRDLLWALAPSHSSIRAMQTNRDRGRGRVFSRRSSLPLWREIIDQDISALTTGLGLRLSDS